MEPAPQLGQASKYANVVHVPATKCPELEMALEALGERMPTETTRVPCCCCCEGLFEVVTGRADVHLSPPDRMSLGQQRTPAPVLCAFAVLLQETGGQLSDLSGQEIDFAAALARGHELGVLASEAHMHNYMLHAVRHSFSSSRLMLPRLSDLEALGSRGPAFRVEHASSGERGSSSDTAADEWSLDGFARRRGELGLDHGDLDWQA